MEKEERIGEKKIRKKKKTIKEAKMRRLKEDEGEDINLC